VRAAQRGSADAVETLVRRNWERAHRTAFLILRDAGAAEDVCQEAMLAAVRSIDKFDRRRPFGPWLHRIVVNRSLDLLRERGRRAEVAQAAEERSAPDTPDRAIAGDLAHALAELDAETRAIVVLRHLLDYSSKEIGAMLDLPPATVRTRLRRALERLRAALEEGTP
jgi:RNA polymerase sigma-70 factor (ECF subfamily)